MKRIILIYAIAAVGCAFALTDTERQYLRNLSTRPRCEARQLIIDGGKTNIVETWRRGGYEWKQTNEVRRIIGKIQSNTFLEQVQSYKLDADMTREMRKKAKKVGKNLEKVLKVLRQVVDKAASEDEAELYRSIIELLEGEE
jgi:uncharacterized FlaG/YvyC family protein